MKRGKRVDPWYPFFIDKWLLGSTRLELIINKDWPERWPQLVPLVPKWVLETRFLDLRGIFADLLTFSKKDSGFIRANERTAYPHEMLAGQFNVDLELLNLTIKICLHKDIGKMSEPLPGIYYIESTNDYSFTDRYKRMVETAAEKGLPFGPTDECSGKPEAPSEKAESIGEDRIGKYRKGEDRKADPGAPFLPTVKRIFKAAGYEFDEKTLLYIAELCAEFPELNHEDEFKAKIAWWVNHPLTKKSNICLQLRNWFVIATERIRERRAGDQVGAAAPTGAAGGAARKQYADFKAEFVKVHGLASEEGIDLLQFPTFAEYSRLRANKSKVLRTLLTPRPTPSTGRVK
jgi:hypothetical protein